MATRKRNEFLDAGDSENDERGYDSEEESRARMLPSAKRQKLDYNSQDKSEEHDHESDIEAHEESEDPNDNNLLHDYPKSSELAHLEQLAAGLPSDLKLSTKLRAPLPLSAPKKDKSGVIYLSRVPPFMKPAVLRSLLTPYGAIGKIFLTPEPSSSRTQRLRGGGTRRKLFLDGWVEFLHKRDAKFVADNLNAQTMGGKKRGRWHDEVWNIKYLSGVKWNHITETIQNENAERTARMRVEISRGKVENRAFLENLEMGKMIEGVERTRRDREEREGGVVDGKEGHGDGGVVEKKEQQRRKPRREFVQHGVTSKAAKKPEPGQDVGRVLNSMF